MSQKRFRWFISAVSILAFIIVGGFLLGRSSRLFPIWSQLFQQEAPSAENTVTLTGASTASNQEELKTRAKGYELVLQRQPEDRTALKGLLEARMEMVRLKMAEVKDVIPPLEKLAKLSPDDTEYGVLLAQAKQYTGDLEGAATVYRSILESKPGNIPALEGLVSLLVEQKRPEAAIGVLQDKLDGASKLNQIQPGSVDAMSVKLLLASVYAEQQRYDQAIALYDETIKANKEDFRPVWGKAFVLQLQGKTDEAKALFETATTIAPAKYKDQIKAKIKQLEAQTPAPTADPESSSSDSTTESEVPAP